MPDALKRWELRDILTGISIITIVLGLGYSYAELQIERAESKAARSVQTQTLQRLTRIETQLEILLPKSPYDNPFGG